MKQLELIKKLHVVFKNKNINYCHWKSTEHLDEALQGDTDLDILVDRRQRKLIEKTLLDIGFIDFVLPEHRKYTAIEDFLGFDNKTGKIIHLHLHYQLTFGKKHLKGYRFPVEKIVLSTKKYLKDENTYIINSEYEYIIFLIRMAVKIRYRNYILNFFRKNYLNKFAVKEYEYLRNKISSVENIRAKSQKLDLSKKTINYIIKVYKSEKVPTISNLKSILKSLKFNLKLYASKSKLKLATMRLYREFMRVIGYVSRNYINLNIFARRKNKTGGFIISFIGPDGAGKSSLIKDINQWLKKDLDVYKIYLGSGDGKSSFIRAPFKKLYDLFIYLGIIKQGDYKNDKEEKTSKGTSLKKLLILPWSLVLTYERKNKLIRALNLKNNGNVVLTDRYPQNQFDGILDGPKINKYYNKKNKNSILKKFKDYEFSVHKLAENYSPDLVIKLNVSPKEAVKRKEEVTIDNTKKLNDLISKIEFKNSKVVSVNSDNEYNEVLSEVKDIIWKEISL